MPRELAPGVTQLATDYAHTCGLPLWLNVVEDGDGLVLLDSGTSQTTDAATEPELLGRLREAMPRSVFLLPGVGAQGGRVELLAPAFAPGPAAALVAASRTIVDAALEAGAVDAARTAAEGLREATWRTAQAAR